MPPRPRRRRSVKTDGDAREKILDAAETLFAAHGFDATSTARSRGGGGAQRLIFYTSPPRRTS